jgi:hypothetical protein
MTKKNNSAEPVSIGIYQQKPDSRNPTGRPALYELGTLGDGDIIIIKRSIGPMKASSVSATERRTE